MTLKLFIESYGCQMNVLDSELIAGKMGGVGYTLTEEQTEADVILFNTCSVREHAEDRALSNAGKLKKLKKQRPDVVIGIVGCMAQNRQDRLFAQLPHVQLIVGPRRLGAIPRLVDEIRKTGQRRIATEDFDEEFIDGAETPATRSSPHQAYVKAMEGCDLSCAFCIVPTTRGSEVSRAPQAIVDECKRLADGGTVEVTLLGQTIDSYGKGLTPRIDLGGLLRRVHDEVPSLKRIRFITSHPSYVRDSLIDALAELPRVCKYLHMPAQSGSDRILKAMRRGYTSAKYVEIVEKLRAKVPGVEIASDWIVGFPGETEDDFAKSVELMERVRFQNAFVFKYSPRPGTPAAAMEDDVAEDDKRRRNAVLLETQERISREKNAAKVGATVEVFVEGPSKRDGCKLTGRTDTNQIVNFRAGRDLSGRFATVTLTSASGLAFAGELV
jgi:tRNA-2-methylthio-N6-dimethylallyladenosine synthase